MLEFPEFLRLPLAGWIDAIVLWIVRNWGGFFDFIGDTLLSGIFGVLSNRLGINRFLYNTPVEWWALLVLVLVVVVMIVTGVVIGIVSWRTRGQLRPVVLLVTGAVVATASIGYSLLYGLLGIERFLLILPWFVVVIAVGLVAWRALDRWWAGLLMPAFLVLIGSFGLWDLAMMTLAIIITAVILSLAIGIPTGIIMARSNLVESILRPVLDAMQTIPTFVYLIPVMMLFGLGKVPAVFATIIYAAPPVIRLTNVGIRQVSPSVIEAARAFGSNARQLLFEVQIPLAIPSIMVGVNQTTMMALAMVVVASMVGATGVGMEVFLSIMRIEVGRGFQAGISIVLLAIIIDRITNAIAARQQHEVVT